MKISGTGPEVSEFAKALGIDPRDSFKIELNITADEIVTVVVHKFVHCHELEALTTLLKKYELHKKEDDE